MTATIAATMTSQEKADSSLVVSAALTEGRMVFASLGIMVLYHDAPDGADAQANATKGTFDDSGPPNAAEARRQCSKGKSDRSRWVARANRSLRTVVKPYGRLLR